MGASLQQQMPSKNQQLYHGLRVKGGGFSLKLCKSIFLPIFGFTECGLAVEELTPQHYFFNVV